MARTYRSNRPDLRNMNIDTTRDGALGAETPSKTLRSYVFGRSRKYWLREDRRLVRRNTTKAMRKMDIWED